MLALPSPFARTPDFTHKAVAHTHGLSISQEVHAGAGCMPVARYHRAVRMKKRRMVVILALKNIYFYLKTRVTK